jgi:hypothetical protein
MEFKGVVGEIEAPPKPQELRREVRELKWAIDELKTCVLDNKKTLSPEVMIVFEKLCSPASLHAQIATIMPLNKAGGIVCPRCKRNLVLKRKPKEHIHRKQKNLLPTARKVKESKGSFFEALVGVKRR